MKTITEEAAKVIWNYFEASSLQMNSFIERVVLAPLATVSGFTGSTMIAQTVSLTNRELHQQSLDGSVPKAAFSKCPCRPLA